ncbi:MAG: NUDIX domain-containing protein, partial [Candidatus Omnitrophica bacterium]|nr:NUDIX domain-containing protein [Candidatus Omnitrophota bacterium]
MKIKGTEILIKRLNIKEADIDSSRKPLCADIESLRRATYSALKLAHKNKKATIVFYAQTLAIKGISFEVVAKIMAQEVFRYLKDTRSPALEKIIFVLSQDSTFKLFKQNVEDYLGHMFKKLSEGPFLTVDGIIEYKNGIVIIERRNPPFGWALPGGFVDYAETVEKAVVREVKEETNLDFVDFKQFGVYSDPKRDPRFHTVGVVFTGKGKGKLRAGDDAKSAKIVSVNSLPETIAF